MEEIDTILQHKIELLTKPTGTSDGRRFYQTTGFQMQPLMSPEV